MRGSDVHREQSQGLRTKKIRGPLLSISVCVVWEGEGGAGLAVKTKSVYEPAEPGDGVRVLITRYYPRGVKKDRFDRRIVALSPSRDLLSSYRRGETNWGQFGVSFLEEMRSNPDSLDAIRSLHELSRVGDVTLLCYERSGLRCHRQLVRDVVAEPGLLLSGSAEAKGNGDAGSESRVRRSSPSRATGRARRAA